LLTKESIFPTTSDVHSVWAIVLRPERWAAAPSLEATEGHGSMRKTVSLVAFVMLPALNAGTAIAAFSAADKTFATKAAQGGLAEVEMSQLALQKATSPQVKQFAQQMVTDHTKGNQELMQLAKSEGIELPSQVDGKHKSTMERLQGMTGSTFDTAYMQDMVQDHQQVVEEFQKQAQRGEDPTLKPAPCRKPCRRRTGPCCSHVATNAAGNANDLPRGGDRNGGCADHS
jgi:predicted outer membrane protein